MALKTKQSLQRMFQESRERQKKKKEQQSKLKLQARKEKYKHQDQILKKCLQIDEKRRMEELQALAKKCSQKPLNEATEPSKPSFKTYSIYRSSLIERNTSENDLYLTREELMAAEDRGEGAIRWDIWDKLVKVRQTSK